MASPSLRSLTPPQRAVLVGAVVAGAAVRIAYQDQRPFTNDEAGSLLFLDRDYGWLLTHFGTWISMNVYLVLTKAIASATHSNPWAMVAPSLAAGLAAIPLTAAIGLRVASARTAVVGAVLVAGNPYLVKHSVQLRSDMLLTTACLAALCSFLDWRRSTAWRDGVACAAALLVAELMHANAVYYAGFVGVLFAAWLVDDLRRGEARWRAAATLVLPTLVAAGIAAAFYVPILAPMREVAKEWTDAPPTSVAYVPYVAGAYFGRGFRVLPSVALLGWGLWTAVRRDAPLATLALAALVPMTLASFAGLSHFPWGYARFFVFSLPLLLLLVAGGVTAIRGARSPLACAALVAVVLGTWTPDLHALFAAKRYRPWIRIGAFLRTHARPADLLLEADVADAFPSLNLRAHLGERRSNFGDVAPFLAGTNDGPPARIIVVEPHEPIETTAPQRRFGTVQVVTYEAPTRVAEVEALLADLERSLHGQVSDTRTGDYRLVLDLLAALGRPDPGAENTDRYYRCLMRTRRQRWAPRQQLGVSPDRE